ncbi:hypothetical protein OCU04_007590 [Sclerotinia nivalis]|uniref:UBC core domain-containing protein n=1 Tax=Sclerotinia nivalis TaxID=352851 RepID=A0A9X0AJ27_9HELO|nr:hypothetical protein OCU04_007590 [Sclerotinia nivalis]
MQVFKASFERFKLRIRKHQKDTSAWKVTSWAVHDAKKFEDLIERLRRYVDGLESITKSLGLLENQHSRLREEIDGISDVESLRLLRDASSSHGNSTTADVSESASKRMVMIVESLNSEGFSFKTACTRQSTGLSSHPNSMPQPPGAWPRSLPSHNKEMGKENQQKPSMACQECLKEHYKCGADSKTRSCLRCMQTGRECISSKSPGKGPATSFTPISEVVNAMYDANTDPSSSHQLSQNRRLMQGLIEMAGPHQALSFSSGDAHYGHRLTAIKTEDAECWVQSSGRLVAAAQAGPAVWKRIFLDLRDIRQANVPFISATPINDSLDTILASIEGPPETPYEGGIFWITFKITDHYPDQLPLMRFNTKIYHPNISPQGYVCCIDSQLQNYPRRLRSLDKWPSGSDRKLDWSIGALLTALCGLLSSPDVDDPLVPEIAHTYLKNYDEYCSNARLYTKKYASSKRPDETHLVFFDISSQEIDTSTKEIDTPASLNSHQRECDSDSDSISLRSSITTFI